MLKIISENQATGYAIIKKVKELTGEKPSTGSVYPILKSMTIKGLIMGRTQDGKTFYEITDLGRSVLDSHGSMKNYYEQKIYGTINLAQGTFNDLHMAFLDDTTLINQVANKISSCLAHGIAAEKIDSVLSKTLLALQKLE